MAYITPTNSKWATWYDVSQALQERTGDYTQDNTQYATKAYIIANFDNIHLEKLNTTNNSIGISYLNTQFVKWADVETVEYVFYIDTVNNTSQIITKDYYAYSQTFVIYSYKNIYKNGALITSNIPVAWHYNSSQTGWVTNSPTSGAASATTITIAIPENKTVSEVVYNWSALQNEGRTSGAKNISIQFNHKAKYGTVAWNPSGDISIVSTATTVDKGILVTGNYNDNISDSQGTDSANISTAITISTSETWVTGITFSLSNSNYRFPMWTSETADRVTTITLTVNDPRLTLSGPATFRITQKMRVVTFDSYAIRVDSSSTNSFGNFTCMGGSRNYTVHSYSNMNYDGTYQYTVNIPYVWTALGWTTISNSSMETFRSAYNSINGTGKGTVSVGESPTEGSGRSGNVNFSQTPYSSVNVNVSISQNEPCMVYHFDISPSSITIPGPTSGTHGITVTSYKIMNNHTESPIPVGYGASTGSSWLTISGNSSPSSSSTTNTITYDQNLGLERSGSITYTQNETNENGSIYTKTLTVNQEAGFIYVYKFSVNGTEGSSSAPYVYLSEYAYNGGTQTVTVKSYAEVHIGSATGTIDHYEATYWSTTGCNWLSASPSASNGTTSPTDSTTVSLTASAQSESSSDNSRCCDVLFTQDNSGKKVNVNGCQEKNQTGYTYTFSVNTSSLSFDACSSNSKTATITSYRDETRNGSVISGTRTNIGYSVDSVPWATASVTSSPSSSDTTTTITVESNSNNTSSRSNYFSYTQNESGDSVRVDISQNGAGCAVYDRGVLQVNIGDGYTTSASKSVSSGTTTINVDFSSPKYLSLCGISSNTKCSDGIESYNVESKPSWITSVIGGSYSTGSDVLTVSMSDVSSERSGTVVYSNAYTKASVTVTQAQGLSYTYHFKVKSTTSTKVSPSYETGSASSFSNTGGTDTFTVESYRTNDLTGVNESVSWSANGTSNITYTTSGGNGTNNASISIGENTNGSSRSGYVDYTQNSSNYSVRIPVSQNAATFDCFLGVWHDSVMDTDINGGTKNISVDSYKTVNGKQGADSTWTASVNGCGTISKNSGPGGKSTNTANAFVLTIPSGTTACSGTVSISNTCGKSESVNYSRSAGNVKWSDPSENTTKTVSSDGTTFTAYADTTGLTASQCEAFPTPDSIVTVGKLQGTGTGSRAVWCTIIVPSNSSTSSRSWDVTIQPK